MAIDSMGHRNYFQACCTSPVIRPPYSGSGTLEKICLPGGGYAEVLIGRGSYYNPPILRNGERVEHIGYTTDIVTGLALDWLKNGDKSWPCMLIYQHKAPHRNWQPGPAHLTMYDDVSIPEPPTLFDDYTGEVHQPRRKTCRSLRR